MSAKVGSTLWRIDHKVPPETLIIGADVFHQGGRKSYAAIVSQFGKDLEHKYSNTIL